MITKFSAAADDLFPTEPEWIKISSGHGFTEGPVWDSAKQCLYFTDFTKDTIYIWTEKDGTLIYRADANRPIGLALDAKGRVISTESSKHRIAYADREASVPIVGSYSGKMLNSPNDVIVSRDGAIYFTDPYSKAMGGPRELDFNGVYRVFPGSELELIWGGFGRPNGLALSLDESCLYVNDTDLQTVFSVSPNRVTEPKILAVLDTAYGPGAADGMKVDRRKNIWVTGPGGLWVLAEDGSPIAILHTPEFTGNFCFADNQVLITASTSVYRLAAR